MNRVSTMIVNAIMSIRRFIVTVAHLVACSLLLSGCFTFPDWLGGESEQERIEGERISILRVDSDIKVDPSLEHVPVLVPRPQENTRWYSSNGYHYQTYPNPALSKKLDQVYGISAGRGAKRKERLAVSPVVAEGKVFTLDAYGTVNAFNALDILDRQWTFKIKTNKHQRNFISGGLTYGEGIVFVNTGSNKIVAIDAASGQLRWERVIESIARSAPAHDNGRVYVNTIDNRLYALDTQNGAILWVHSGIQEDISQHGAASPVALANIVYAPYSSGDLYALRGPTGHEMWFESLVRRSSNTTFEFRDIDSTPVVSGGKMFTLSSEGVVSALDMYNGTRIWQHDMQGNQNPWVVADFMFILSNNNELVAVHIPSGNIKWIQELPSYRFDLSKNNQQIDWAGPVMAGNRLVLTSDSGKLAFINPVSGRLEDVVKIPNGVHHAPVVAHNSIYLMNKHARLIVVRNKDFGKKVSEGLREFKKRKQDGTNDDGLVDSLKKFF